ncbi:Gfo/Idh/MocA family oxidoreductase [Agromyces sp. G08B096]|uniref:Gfo/Idh/MocA family oxidoreductase n=1 Tax=Agromyces sp. G08B096 TaxID=3156399 RepID=A0AAU7W5S6_9MICO
MTAGSRPRVAVVGLGAISQSVHLPLIRRNAERLELAAVVDLSRDRARAIAAAHGGAVAAFGSIDELLAAVAEGAVAVDGVVLATSGSHAPDVERLVAAGIRVLAEKPLAFSLAEIERLRATAAEAGRDPADWVRVGYMKEHDPASEMARELLANVRLRHVQVEVLHPADGAQLAFANLAAPPADVPEQTIAALMAQTSEIILHAIGTTEEPLAKLYPNVVLGSVIHDIGLLRHLVGGIGAVDRAAHWAGFPGSVSLGGRLAEQPDVPWAIDWHFIPEYPEYRETATFHHEQGSISLRFAVPYVLNAPTVLTVVDGVAPLGSRIAETRFMQEEAFERELRAFADLLEGRPSDGPSVDAAAADILVGQRMIRAIAEAAGTPLPSGAEAAAAPNPSAPTET